MCFVWLVVDCAYDSFLRRIDIVQSLLRVTVPFSGSELFGPHYSDLSETNFRRYQMIQSLKVIWMWVFFFFCQRPFTLDLWSVCSSSFALHSIHSFHYIWLKKMDSDTLGSPDFLLCSNEAFDASRFNKEAFPNGSPVAVHTNEKGPSAWFAFPKCTSSSRPQQWFLFPGLGSHVYAFVPHYSATASTDPHLAFKFPDQPGSHGLMTRLLLQLNSLCSSYSD